MALEHQRKRHDGKAGGVATPGACTQIYITEICSSHLPTWPCRLLPRRQTCHWRQLLTAVRTANPGERPRGNAGRRNDAADLLASRHADHGDQYSAVRRQCRRDRACGTCAAAARAVLGHGAWRRLCGRFVNLVYRHRRDLAEAALSQADRWACFVLG